MRLERDFYQRPTLEVAPELLGKYFVFHSPAGKLVGEINEVEAYLGEDDPASHAFRGKTARTEVMFGEAGFTYVYFIYGMYNCINFVTETHGKAGAVLIRSVIPREGFGILAENYGKGGENLNEKDYQKMTNGPGKFCKSFGVKRIHNGIDLITSQEMYVEDRVIHPQFSTSPRIGISKATDKLWRFYY